MAIERIIKAAVERGASDVHIKAGDVVRARIDGRLIVLTKQSLTADQTRAIALHFMSGELERATIDSLRDHDCSWSSPGIGRFRVNILRQRTSHSIVLRVIPAAEWQDGFVSKNLPQAERVYLHIDMDVIDAAVNPGVNFRKAGGLSLSQVETALRTVRGRYPIAAAALTNYNPDRDVDWKTRTLGLRLARLISNIV